MDEQELSRLLELGQNLHKRADSTLENFARHKKRKLEERQPRLSYSSGEFGGGGGGGGHENLYTSPSLYRLKRLFRDISQYLRVVESNKEALVSESIRQKNYRKLEARLEEIEADIKVAENLPEVSKGEGKSPAFKCLDDYRACSTSSEEKSEKILCGLALTICWMSQVIPLINQPSGDGSE